MRPKPVPKIIRKPGLDARSSFAVAVKERRHQLGITQEELGWRAGLHRTYVTDIERGARNLSLQSIEKLARALEAPIAELLANPANGGGDAGLSVDILLAEGNPDDAELTLQSFRAARLTNRVHTVRDGVAAVDFLFRQGSHAKTWSPHQPLVVLLDLNLPKLNGVELLRLLRSDARTLALPVVVLTTSDQSRELAECRKLGGNAHLVKPVGFANFSKLIPDLRFDWTLVRSAPPGG